MNLSQIVENQRSPPTPAATKRVATPPAKESEEDDFVVVEDSLSQIQNELRIPDEQVFNLPGRMSQIGAKPRMSTMHQMRFSLHAGSGAKHAEHAFGPAAALRNAVRTNKRPSEEFAPEDMNPAKRRNSGSNTPRDQSVEAPKQETPSSQRGGEVDVESSLEPEDGEDDATLWMNRVTELEIHQLTLLKENKRLLRKENQYMSEARAKHPVYRDPPTTLQRPSTASP